MLKVLLFDLDGTLLPLDLEIFMQRYFAALAPKLQGYRPPELVAKWILSAMKEVVENEYATLTNEDKFRKELFAGDADLERQIWPIFESFYENEFQHLQHLTSPDKISREICRTAIEKGYRVVIATNPIFPSIATHTRLDWAGVGDLDFELVTTMENSHFSKPNPKYYLEILESIGVEADACMMFGNDVQEDGVAGLVGMHTFLVTDYLIDREVGTLEFDHRGTLQDVFDFVTSLPDVTLGEPTK